VRPELDETAPAPAPTPDRTATREQGAAIEKSPGLAAGLQLGHFRIEKPLGAGGMGEVYLGTDLALDRPVAIKVLPALVASDPKRRERMIREARAQARVTHPNVGHIYFIGEDSDRLYFAMEYVAGTTLAEKLAKGPLPVDDALAVIRSAALGLREAQRSGFTHRDVKPSNLMIDHHGVVKVLDFGLAAGGSDGALASGPIAQTSLAGTPLYMAPEQARGEAVDFRSDIYALGATLYHLVTGKPPFEADSVEKLVTLHASAARPGVARRGLKRIQVGQLDALCARMMAAKPEDRFASYDELLRALELASASHTRPGGFWARALAMTIDFAIIAIVLALVEGAASVSSDTLALDISGLLMLPTMLAVHALCIARWGTTLGKSVMELEVVDVLTHTRPSLGRAFARGAVMFGLPIVLDLVILLVNQLSSYEVRNEMSEIGTFVVIAFGLSSLGWAALRLAGKRARWDRVARTMVRYRTARTDLTPA
jgi:uncharacterized RDD family membrane protein YckC